MADNEKLNELARNLEELKRRQEENRLSYYKPYAKQRTFHELGATARERMFLAGNQLGKTYSGAAEMAMHLTGLYPSWWQGRRFAGPVRAWAAGVTGESTRDNPQRLLLGPLGLQGTGSIPKDRILEVRNGRGIPDAVDSVLVRHKDGGTSQLGFKSYERGREKLQGETLDVIWLDEEPPSDIYTEVLARITARQGLVYLTATPLLGMSEVVRRFISEPNESRSSVTMTIDDVEHISAAEKQIIIDAYPEHEREARVKGIPMLGEGRVFPIAEELIREPAMPIAKHWPRICGMDFGYDHPTAAAWLAWDRDADAVHIYDVYRLRKETPVIHAAAIKARGEWIPVAWPHDGQAAEKGSGDTLAAIYKKQGLKMLSQHATFADGGNSVEAGVMEMLQRMQTGRLKVAEHLEPFFDEFRLYHRKDGRIVKEHDDVLSACRYGLMMLRAARTAPDYSRMSETRMARDIDFPLLGGSDSVERSRAPGTVGVRWGNPPYDRPTRANRSGTASGADYDIFS